MVKPFPNKRPVNISSIEMLNILPLMAAAENRGWQSILERRIGGKSSKCVTSKVSQTNINRKKSAEV